MKTILSLLTGIGLMASATTTHATVLFEENWSTFENGQSAVGGRWAAAVGTNTQFVVNPTPGGKALQFNYTPAVALPMMITNEVFTMPEGGIRLSADITFTGTSTGDTTSMYMRVGIQAASAANVTNNYWFETWESIFRSAKAAPTVANLGTYSFKPTDWEFGETATFSMTIVPEGPGTRIKLFLNGEMVNSYLDSSGGLPDFSDGFKVYVAGRDPREGYISNVKLEAIPEGSSYALLLGGIGALLFTKRLAAAAILK